MYCKAPLRSLGLKVCYIKLHVSLIDDIMSRLPLTYLMGPLPLSALRGGKHYSLSASPKMSPTSPLGGEGDVIHWEWLPKEIPTHLQCFPPKPQSLWPHLVDSRYCSVWKEFSVRVLIFDDNHSSDLQKRKISFKVVYSSLLTHMVAVQKQCTVK